jgi:GNAT superfamily N-acetyltransferase
VRTARDKRQFVDLPYRLHRGNQYWIAPLKIAQKQMLDTKKHPFYKTSDAEMFLAEREGRVVGRIMAIFNRAHNEFHNESAGFFGFFEVEEDLEAAQSLFVAARGWLAGRGATVMRGPVNPSTNYECGLLIEGFDMQPAVMMPYNPAYYVELIERCGLKKAKDLYAYELDQESFRSAEKLKRVAERLKQRDRIRVRSVDLKQFRREVEIVRQVYNNAWQNNWGFVPVTEEEFYHLAKDLKQIADPEIAMIAEQENEEAGGWKPVGFFLGVPDVNQALSRLNGRLLPFGLLKLLYYSRKINQARVIIMGVVKEFQNYGAGSLFLSEIRQRSHARGYMRGEMGWVLEDNIMMHRAMELIGGSRYKTYRIYETPL